jgi:meso-butanediol dehydrogenase/(S,S)-butanediol dehydrogenase/diacetyl reductase
VGEGRHEGRGVFVSGGTKGIGLAAAERFAAEGARVFVVGRDENLLASTLSQLPEERVAGCVCDVSVESDVVAAFEHAMAFLRRLDVAFANAGIDGQNRGVLELEAEAFRRILAVNCLGSFLVAREAARRMPDGGAIILNASVSGLVAEAGFADYSASKGAQILLGRTMARELGPLGFWVTIVCPGYVSTPMSEPYLRDPEIGPEIVRQIPSGRVAQPAEVAALVSFLATREAAHMNGSVVTIDGGRLA